MKHSSNRNERSVLPQKAKQERLGALLSGFVVVVLFYSGFFLTRHNGTESKLLLARRERLGWDTLTLCILTCPMSAEEPKEFAEAPPPFLLQHVLP